MPNEEMNEMMSIVDRLKRSEPDPIVALLQRHGGEITRRRYLELRFMDPGLKPEHDLGPELEMSIPASLRHPRYKTDEGRSMSPAPDSE